MLNSLLTGISPHLNDDSTPEIQGGVKLRREQVRLVLFDGKADIVEAGKHTSIKLHILTPTALTASSGDEHTILGSLGVITGHSMQDDRSLPDWLEQGTESLLRDTEDDSPPVALSLAQHPMGPSRLPLAAVTTLAAGTSPTTASTMQCKASWTNLDRFYEDDDDGDGDDEDHEQLSDDDEQSADDNNDESTDEDNSSRSINDE